MTQEEREEALSDSYLRLRQKLEPWGALRTKFAGVDRFEVTEAALDALLEEYGDLKFRMEGLEK